MPPERQLDGLLARGADVGEAHAVSGKQRREGVNEHTRHAERVGDQASVLAARASEAVERVARDVIAALHRNLLDRIGHVLDRDLDESVGNVFGLSAANLLGKVGEGHAHGMRVERQVSRRSENLRKEIGDELADHHIGVGDGKRSIAPVTFWAGIGARGIRADAEAGAVKMQDRTAAGGDSVDQHHRRAHAHAGDFRFEGALILAVEMRDVGRCATHVEADQAVQSGLLSGLRHADHPAGRTGQDRILALE